MQLLNSENYEGVLVHLRDTEVVELPAVTGMKLMDYLTKEPTTKHVKLTTKQGAVLVVLITDIRKIEPVQKHKEFEKIMEKFV